MLFSVQNCNRYLVYICEKGKEKKFFKRINKELSMICSDNKYKSIKGCSKNFIDFVQKDNIFLSWESNCYSLGLGYIETNDILKVSHKKMDVNTINIIKQHLGYLFLPKNISKKNDNKFVSNELLNNNYELLTDIIIMKPLTDVYYLYIEICKQDEELIYQSFINYINTCMGLIENNGDYNIDIAPFVSNMPDNIKSNCNQLLIYYIDSKRRDSFSHNVNYIYKILR